MDDAKAVGAVDGPFHVRLERNLGLVAAARADRGEVLTRAGVASACHAASAVTRGSPGRDAPAGSQPSTRSGLAGYPSRFVRQGETGPVDPLTRGFPELPDGW